MKRKRYSKELKTRVALAAIKRQKTASELASEYEVHVSQINIWKKQALEALPEVFGRGQEREEAQREVGRDRLFQQIGKLQVEVGWLKKRPDISPDGGGDRGVHYTLSPYPHRCATKYVSPGRTENKLAHHAPRFFDSSCQFVTHRDASASRYGHVLLWFRISSGSTGTLLDCVVLARPDLPEPSVRVLVSRFLGTSALRPANVMRSRLLAEQKRVVDEDGEERLLGLLVLAVLITNTLVNAAILRSLGIA